MIHPDTKLEFIGDEVGFGVVATRFIPAGTIVWALDDMDQRLPADSLQHLDPIRASRVERYAYADVDGDGELILCWDHARFVNHSCEATCLSEMSGFELAIRDIQPGEQLTDDYRTFMMEQPMNCLCGSNACSGIIRPGDHRLMRGHWRSLYQSALSLSGGVPQPLGFVLEQRLPQRSSRPRVH